MDSATAVMETRFSEDFKRLIGLEANNALRAIRNKAFSIFADKGFPTVKNEDWKYTNVAPMAAKAWKAASILPKPTVLDEEAFAFIRQFGVERNGFTALNLAFADIRVFRIPADTAADSAIELEFAAEAGEAHFPHILIIAEAGSSARIVERYSAASASFTNSAVQVAVGENASVTHYRVQRDSGDSLNYGVTEVAIAGGGFYDLTSINMGGALSRHDIEVKFLAEGGEARVDGLYLLSGKQHADTHSVIDHAMPNCTSRQNYKGILNDSSRGVFNGKVFVRANAHGTDAQQSNKNLLLSTDARIDTKPQLEIFNDDVRCSHGATVGQLEEEELFYLLTRGLPEQTAKNLLTYGFAEEIINKIQITQIKEELDQVVLNRLAAKLGD